MQQTTLSTCTWLPFAFFVQPPSLLYLLMERLLKVQLVNGEPTESIERNGKLDKKFHEYRTCARVYRDAFRSKRLGPKQTPDSRKHEQCSCITSHSLYTPFLPLNFYKSRATSKGSEEIRGILIAYDDAFKSVGPEHIWRFSSNAFHFSRNLNKIRFKSSRMAAQRC